MVKLIGFRRFNTKAKENKPSREMVMLFTTEPIDNDDKTTAYGLSSDVVMCFPDMVENIDLISAVNSGSYLDIRYNKSGFVVSIDVVDK